MRNNLHGGDEKERLEDGVGLVVEVLGVPKKSGALGREQRACPPLGEELDGGKGVSNGGEEKERAAQHLLEARQTGEGLVLALEGLGGPAQVHISDFLQHFFNLHGAGGSLEDLLVLHLVLEKDGDGGL